MPYMLLVMEPNGQRKTRSDAEGRAVYERMLRFGEDLRARGLLVASESLSWGPDTARVEVREGRKRVLDGPFAEAKEIIGGFFLLDCATRDDAIAIAAQCPAAEWCSIEVRSLGPCFQ
jgi:hypothetical protein